MQEKNPFDTAIRVQTQMPAHLRNAAIHTTDTLDLAWKAAQAVFEGKAKPEHALTLLPVFLEQAEAERQRRSIPSGGETGDGPSPSAPWLRG